MVPFISVACTPFVSVIFASLIYPSTSVISTLVASGAGVVPPPPPPQPVSKTVAVARERIIFCGLDKRERERRGFGDMLYHLEVLLVFWV